MDPNHAPQGSSSHHLQHHQQQQLYHSVVRQPSVPSISRSYSHHNEPYFSAPTQPIDVDALAAGVQRYIPNPANAYISLPAGMDPASVDFRTFYPYNPSEVKHRKRTTRAQLKILEDTFKRETKPNAALRKSLAAELEMTPRGVQVWFQNRRAKEKALAKKSAGKDGDRKPAINDTDDHDQDDGSLSPITESKPPNDEQSPSLLPLSSASPETSPEPAQAQANQASPRDAPVPAINADNSNADTASTAPAAMAGNSSTAATAIEEDSPKRALGPLPSGLGVSRMSWQGPGTRSASASASDAAASVSRRTTPFAASIANEDNIVNLRRPSLPTHLGVAVPGHGSSFGAGGGPPPAFRMRPSMNMGMGGYDLSQRRPSLDRLASHPYAHVAVAANGAIYGSLRPATHLHNRLPIGPRAASTTPSGTPQLHRSELPPTASAMGASADGHARPELMHRASMPAPALHPHVPRSFDFPGAQPAYRMRFPREGHVYALSPRHYQPPIPGPLPAPGYSFGTSSTSSSSEGEADAAGAIAAGANNSSGSLQAFAFAREVPEQGDDGEEVAPQYDAYSRFGSIASVADSESSIASGYYSEVGSFDVRPSTSHSMQGQGLFDHEGRRQSCASQFLDMFSNLDVHNNSTTSIPEQPKTGSPGNAMMQDLHGSNSNSGSPESNNSGSNATDTYPSPSSTVSGRSKDARPSVHEMLPISSSSELAFALQPQPQSTPTRDVQHENMSMDSSSGDLSGMEGNAHGMSSDSDAPSLRHSHCSSSSGSSLMYPLSASSSRSSIASLGQGHHQQQQPQLAVDTSIEYVSLSGHYSPVSQPGGLMFDFPSASQAQPRSAMGMGMGTGNGIGGGHAHGMMGQPHQMGMGNMYGGDEYIKLPEAKDYMLHAQGAQSQDSLNFGLQMSIGEELSANTDASRYGYHN